MAKITLSLISALLLLNSCTDKSSNAEIEQVDGFGTIHAASVEALSHLTAATQEQAKSEIAFFDSPKNIVRMKADRLQIRQNTYYESIEAQATSGFGRRPVECEEYVVAGYDLTDTANQARVNQGIYTKHLTDEDVQRSHIGMQNWKCSGYAEFGIPPLDTNMAALPNLNVVWATGSKDSEGKAEYILKPDDTYTFSWDTSNGVTERVAIILFDMEQSMIGEQEKPYSYILTPDDGEISLTSENLQQFESGQKIAIAFIRTRMIWTVRAENIYHLAGSVLEEANYLVQ